MRTVKIDGKTWHIVREYPTESQAEEERQRLKAKGIFARVWISQGPYPKKPMYIVLISDRDYEYRDW